MLSREDIIKHMGDIVAEYDADPNKYAYALGRFIGLYDVIKIGDLIPDITLADVDRMALETLTMEGKITIRESSPADPSVGWPGSVEITGEITGRFEVPAGVMIVGPYTQPHVTIDDCAYSVPLYLSENPDLWKKIIEMCDIPSGYSSYKPNVYFTGTTPKKGDRAVVEFKVVIKES